MAKINSLNEAEIASRVLRHWHEVVPNDRMAHLVKDETGAFLRSPQARLARHEVQLGHWTFPRILWNRDGIAKREPSMEAGVMEPTTFMASRVMESLGYVTLEQLADNRKNVYVFPTGKGNRLKQVLAPLAEDINAIAVAGLSEREIATTRKSLLMMIDNIAREPDLGG